MVMLFLALRIRVLAPAVKGPTLTHDDGTPLALAG